MKNRDEIKKKIQSMSEDELIDLLIKKEDEILQKEDEILQKKDQILRKNNEINWYKEQLAILNKLRFATKSDKVSSLQLNLFNEAEEIYDASVTEEAPVVEEAPKKKGRKKKVREANFSALPQEVIHHHLEDQNCYICGTRMKELAPQIVDVLKYQPARYIIERHIIHQYICSVCTEENLAAEIVIAEGAPNRLIKGSVASPSVVAGIVFNKYVSGTPLYRQEQELKRQKVEISRSNMSNWLMKCGTMLEPLYHQMLEDLRKQSHIHMDETTLTVLEDKKEGNRSKSYMWMMGSGKHEENQMVIYQYHKNREHAFAKELLGDYRGGIHCDGYEAYHKLDDDIVIFGCLEHAKRYFVEALEVSPIHKEAKHLSAKQLSQLCEQTPQYGNLVEVVKTLASLFKYEKEYAKANLTPAEIQEKRQEEQKPKLDELFTRLLRYEKEYTAQSKAGKAIRYALNQWKYITAYLNDGAAEISNNRAERNVKSFVMGRKAWLFSNTKSGAKMSSIYYSLIESAKYNGLNIHSYLEYILTQIQDHPDNPNYKRLLPYAKELPESLNVKEPLNS